MTSDRPKGSTSEVGRLDLEGGICFWANSAPSALTAVLQDFGLKFNRKFPRQGNTVSLRPFFPRT